MPNMGPDTKKGNLLDPSRNYINGGSRQPAGVAALLAPSARPIEKRASFGLGSGGKVGADRPCLKASMVRKPSFGPLPRFEPRNGRGERPKGHRAGGFSRQVFQGPGQRGDFRFVPRPKIRRARPGRSSFRLNPRKSPFRMINRWFHAPRPPHGPANFLQRTSRRRVGQNKTRSGKSRPKGPTGLFRILGGAYGPRLPNSVAVNDVAKGSGREALVRARGTHHHAWQPWLVPARRRRRIRSSSCEFWGRPDRAFWPRRA